jgi:hypothetical protein
MPLAAWCPSHKGQLARESVIRMTRVELKERKNDWRQGQEKWDAFAAQARLVPEFEVGERVSGA